MSENIDGGIYGVEVDAEVAASLLVEEGSTAAEPTEASSEPNGEEATVAKDQTQETEQQVEAEDAPSIDEVEIDGKVHSYEDIRLALDDSKNRSEWQKSNTQKSQDVADQRKAIDQESQQWEDLRKDEDLMDTLKDYLGEDHSLFTTKVEGPSEAIRQDTKEPAVDDKVNDRIQELEDKLEMQEANQAVERDIQALVKSHPELDGQTEAVQEVLQTAVDKGMTDLEDAFILTNHQTAVDSAFAKAVKTLEEAKSSKSVPEADVKHDGERSPVNTKPQDYDEAREVGLKYDLYQ
jgi:predicted component of type VI protein secretion system|tara:strand:- start:3391 stop:4269 length:879 start_codon:yes stop_codon:yes gene_type:complete